LNAYYEPALKQSRLDLLLGQPNFHFEKTDLADRKSIQTLFAQHGFATVVHLAAQAGVRYSIDNPDAYIEANLEGFKNVLEGCRHTACRHLIYASSSSVYGANTKMPFSVADNTDRPVSLYAATKKANELMAYCYSHLYRLPVTGLRFFTVYGPWMRPDMAAWIFTEAILAGRPIRVFNHGDMRRDFTYIDVIVAGVLACLDRPPADGAKAPPCRLYNLGTHRSEELRRFIGLLETAIGRKATIELAPMAPGDVPATYADIAASQRDFGFSPSTSIDVGLPRFVAWYRDFHRV